MKGESGQMERMLGSIASSGMNAHADDSAHNRVVSRIHAAPHLLGCKNLKNVLRSGDYRIREDVFAEVLTGAASQGIYPEIDAFSSKAHMRHQITGHRILMLLKDWSLKTLWISPPVKHMSHIVKKKTSAR